MSGCRRHSGTPSKRKPSLLESARDERELLFERRLMEQRARNCAIRLSSESYSKNEF